MQTIAYGPLESQEGDLYLPQRIRPPLVCLLHGGFWRTPYGREGLSPIARSLAARGLVVWNLEYRRLGSPEGGWPGTFRDVGRGIDFLSDLVASGADLDLDRVIVTGHSAGGHLALWCASQKGRRSVLGEPGRVHPVAVAGLAPVADLNRAYATGAGGNAVGELLGGAPEHCPGRYAATSPMALLPLGVSQLIVHGTMDEALPVGLSRDYARAASAAGDQVQLSELQGVSHMDHLDPDGEAHGVLCQWLDRIESVPPRMAS